MLGFNAPIPLSFDPLDLAKDNGGFSGNGRRHMIPMRQTNLRSIESMVRSMVGLPLSRFPTDTRLS